MWLVKGSEPTLILRRGEEEDLESDWQVSGVIVPDWLSGSVELELMLERQAVAPGGPGFQDDVAVVPVRATDASEL